LYGWLRRGRDVEPEDEPRVSYAANFAVRLFQVHFALIVVVSALHKLQFGPWWGGWAIFYPLHSPFDYTFDTFRARMGGWTTNLVLLSLMQYVWMAWQLAFPVFAWRTGWLSRTILLGGGVIGWIGVLVIYGLPLFGPIYLIGCLSYLKVAEWQWLGTTMTEMAGNWSASAAKERPVRVGSSG
jgi:hypothetical protein